jgi:hypothetical protein
VPRDECFNHVKKADFTSYLLKAISAGILPLATRLGGDERRPKVGGPT